MLDGLFPELYKVGTAERLFWCQHWCGPERLEVWKKTLIAHYPKEPADGDGQNVEIYCTAAPARFYDVVVLPTPNSVGEVQPGVELITGSGQEELARVLAIAFSTGMIGLRTKEDE